MANQLKSAAGRTPIALARVLRILGRAALAALPALAAGLVASFAATALMLLLRLALGIVTLPELVAELVLPMIDARTFVGLLIHYGKIQPLTDILVGQLALGVLVAPIYPILVSSIATRLRARSAPDWLAHPRWLAAAALAAGQWLLALALFWPKLAENLLGYPVAAARVITVAGLLAIFALYGATLALVYRVVAAGHMPGRPADAGAAMTATASAASLARRTLLVRAGVAAVGGVVLGGLGLDVLIRQLFTRSNLAYEGSTTRPPVSYITPNENFYVVSKNVLDPAAIRDDWALDIGGLVARPGRYDLADLQALPQETRAITLECIANGVDGHLISTAVWRGVTLQHLLDARGGVAPTGSQIIFTSADGYQSSLPLAELLASGTLLAWEMNGVPLPHRHGYPLRAVVPGRFGEQSPKWLTGIEVADHTYKGFYQQQGWYDGPLYTISRIDNPGKHARLSPGATVHMHGIAFAGTRGIRSVDVSLDGGQTWQAATFAPPLSQQTWVLWAYDWVPTAPGAYTLVVRATDGAGAPQIVRQQGTVPNGGTGLHMVPVTVG